MKCLITGAAGFIGSHLCDQLLAEGHTVIGVDNLVTGNKKNIVHLESNPQFTFFEHDVTLTLPHSISAEVIFHFASAASPPKYQAYPIETLRVNSEGTYQLLEKARGWDARFIYASTSEMYGDPKEHPQRETYWGNVNPIGPRSCYDEAKRFGEAITYSFIRKYDLDGRIVRIFNTFGPRMDLEDGRVVTNFISQALKKEPLALYGDGMQTRSFCYVSDLVSGIIKVGFEDKARGEVFNLGNPRELTIAELAHLIQKLTGARVGTTFEELPENDPTRRQPDITKAKTLLGWLPEISLENGLKKTIAFYQS